MIFKEKRVKSFFGSFELVSRVLRGFESSELTNYHILRRPTKLDVNLNKNIFSVKLEDDLNKPKIIVDVQDLIKNILEKKLDKYINKEDDAQKIELLKGIKSLF